jgi:predicted PurR-regulated permease PerM
MVLEGPKIVQGALAVFEDRRRAERVRRVGDDCARTITGYLSGNLLISIIAGVATYVVLLVLDVPYAGLLALFVGIADLIPLVGATLGAVVVTAAAFTQGVKTGLIVLAFFIVYQQVENHLLQPVIYSRTVQLNPLTALIAILIFTNLSGLLGALLAIPLAGMIQIIIRDSWDHRRGRLKEEPTVGEDRRPAAPAATEPLPQS